MHPALELYLELVLEAAELAARDERAVREELGGHLARIERAMSESAMTGEEVYAMVENEFGEAAHLGASIARAKGRFRTYLKKQARRAPLYAAIALTLALVIRWQFLQGFRVVGDSMAPVVPAGAWVMVSKTSSVDSGDLVVCRGDDDRNIVARVDRVDGSTATLSKYNVRPEAAGEWPKTLARDRVVGRVWLIRR